MRQMCEFDSGQLFSGRATGRMIKGWTEPNEYTPKFNPDYVFPQWMGDIFIWFRSLEEPLYIFGPTGCGKTSCLKQVAAKLNYGVYEVTGHSRLEFPELVGHHTVVDGNMRFEYGPLAKAMKDGGVFLINEMDLLDPSTAAGLNSILDGSPLCIPENGGEVIQPHPMFRFVATANSNGTGDDTGMYQGILRQNIALLDRFVVCEASYLPGDVENKLVARIVPDLPDDTRDKLIEYCGMVRNLFLGKSAGGVDGTLEVTMSTRTLLRAAQLILLYEPFKKKGVDVIQHALDRALCFKASPVSRQTLAECKQRVWG